jgi:hypothetical protein
MRATSSSTRLFDGAMVSLGGYSPCLRLRPAFEDRFLTEANGEAG